ncbi:hypothetical protein FA15DRAFT_656785 [Coprinopsis marcescibilis]|uniref:Uncharacterized protein n=1 Tax=Coprinopsis marcescibilis TaxID=230819 RepID=A0A5C3KU31_COPMA|nr:hypothetical protein FA15DRAFT_656785 [Coprinopsis marcescibilis]
MDLNPRKRCRLDHAEYDTEVLDNDDPYIVEDDRLDLLYKKVWRKALNNYVRTETLSIPSPPVIHPTCFNSEDKWHEGFKLTFQLLHNDIIKLFPSAVFNHLPKDSDSKAFLIRKEYRELLKSLTGGPVEARTLIVTGQGGIGKSTGLMAILLFLLADGQPVAYQGVEDHVFHFFDDNGYQSLTEVEFKGKVKFYCRKKTVIYRLVDLGPERQVKSAALETFERHLYICTRTRGNYATATAQHHTNTSLWYMHPFSWAELYTLFKFSNPREIASQMGNQMDNTTAWTKAEHLVNSNPVEINQIIGSLTPNQLFRFLYIVFGGSARNTLFARGVPGAFKSLQRILEALGYNPDFKEAWQQASTAEFNLADLRPSPVSALVPLPTHENRDVALYSPASAHILDALTERSWGLVWEIIANQYSGYILTPEASFLAGLMFEHLLHVSFLKPEIAKTSHKLIPLSPQEEPPGEEKIIKLKFDKQTFFFKHSNEIENVEGRYYRPNRWNNTGFDSCATIGKKLHLFQFTIAQHDHRFNANCLEELPLRYRTQSVNLVFVVPQERRTFITKRKYIGSDSCVTLAEATVTQYLLKVSREQFIQAPTLPSFRNSLKD